MKRPHILVNVAMTVDGKIDSAARKGAAISSQVDKARVDGLRASVDAVLVGGRTLLNEDPKLTVKSASLRAERLKKGWPENPAKVGILSDFPPLAVKDGVSTQGSIGIPASWPLKHFLTSGPAQVYLFTTDCIDPEIINRIEIAGAKVHSMGNDRVDLPSVFQSLKVAGINSVLVEGGGMIISELFRLNLVDELTIYITPKIFGGATAPTLADGSGFLAEEAPALKLISVEVLDDEGGILVHYLRKPQE